ncbi:MULTISPECIES: HlyD family efflux transporter periplasmic adaptor subunit [Prochlorococcus]|uniref:Putative ABC transporter component n=1 Tax=Prochlorococcus marinus str. MIT 9116 TaxID=167544 RepID=A0A0A1ZV31_PROMR|nr:HlyD family efflux transporter periplasmic adaptor subunit [Prochlorococcus marinus]KGF89724.1 putative ABC transporter component [Prochlorococcus marinus str. MIT 9107]KGF92426.1 putative ABC transporter component [Prochlorococcus marinus str. MIT 9116]KGF92746.1 putative ABC transporter component [Prochlorococcus marinus str. MIT 9123]
MNLKTLKKLFIYFLLFPPFSAGITSCSGNDKSSSKLKEEITADFIQPIKAVAALGQLSPSGEIRQLAAPISQFGSSPRIIEILVNEGDFVKKGDILAIFENREKLIADFERNYNLINSIDDEISLKKDQIKRYELALSKDAYSFVQLSQRKDELLKLQKQKINLIGDKKNIEIDLFNSKLRSPIDGFILEINTRVGERPKNEGILDIGSSQKMEALIEVYESDIDRVFISQAVELSSENGGFQKILKGNVIRISPQVKQRKVLSTDPTGDADSRIIEVLVKLDKESIDIVQNYAGMKVIAKFIP